MTNKEGIFDDQNYNWCALEKIKSKDDMDKLRSLYLDLEQPIASQHSSPLSFQRISGLADEECQLYTGKSLSQLLLGKDTQLNQLRVLKDYGKIMMMQVFPATTQRTGTLLYAGAIAQALVRCEVKISNLTYQQLNESFCNLLSRPYLIKPYRDLFEAAVYKCR